MVSLEHIVEDLRAEPLFHMSLGSKELFHSNLLAWLAGKYPGLARCAFGPWCIESSAAVAREPEREVGHIDLVLRLGGLSPLVIETKVFRLRDERQLDDYASGTARRFAEPKSLVLLSLADPGWNHGQYPTEHGTWQFRSYGELADRLVDIVDEVARVDAYDGATLKHYVSLARTLSELEAHVRVGCEHETVTIDEDTRKTLAAARIADASQKLRSQSIVALLRRAMAEDLGNARINCGFTNGMPFFEAFAPMDDGDRVGWQLQGGQFRLAFILDSLEGRSEEARVKREDKAEALGRWFDFNPLREICGTAKTSKRERLNHFAPDFVYRYMKVPQLSVRQLLAVGKHYTKAACEFDRPLKGFGVHGQATLTARTAECPDRGGFLASQSSLAADTTK